MIPITQENQGDRFFITGASVLPPSGQGWQYNIINPERIHFGKLGKHEGQTITAITTAHRLPITNTDSDFLEKIKNISWQDTNNDDFNLLYQESLISSEKKALCARLERSYQEFNSRYAPEDVQYLIIKDICLTCQHPENNAVGVSFCLSERSWPGIELKEFENIANDFFQKAKFEQLY